uniref:Uncharacterized protein n=1 Tax=Anguilla anguilla TaxID=7936 RepID=A0A0E9PSE8_ANGAN
MHCLYHSRNPCSNLADCSETASYQTGSLYPNEWTHSAPITGITVLTRQVTHHMSHATLLPQQGITYKQ